MDAIERQDGLHIRLRDIRLGDLETLAYWELPGHRWQELDAPYLARPEDRTPEAIEARMERLRQRIRTGGFRSPRIRLAIAERATDRFLGTVNRYWESEETRWASVGICIYDPDRWAQGLGYEALGLWMDYLLRAFPEWQRLGLATWSGNLGMMRLAQKLGLLEEARYRMARIFQGAYFDSVAYGCLRTEWEARFPAGFAAHLRERAGDRG